MAREILFQAKRAYSRGWVEGHLIVFPKSKITKIMVWNAADLDFDAIEVIPETVGQFTGLTDKNGKKIFEGDIITFPWGEERPTELFEIVFNEGQYLAQPLAHDGEVWAITLNGYTHDMEVVGNIHDNPELLNGEES